MTSSRWPSESDCIACCRKAVELRPRIVRGHPSSGATWASDVDLITPMMSQLTYEGLIDEMWGISAGHFDPPFDTTNPDQPAEPRAKKIH